MPRGPAKPAFVPPATALLLKPAPPPATTAHAPVAASIVPIVPPDVAYSAPVARLRARPAGASPRASVAADHAAARMGALLTFPPGQKKLAPHFTPDALVLPAGQPKPGCDEHAAHAASDVAPAVAPKRPAGQSVGAPEPAGQ